MDQLVDNSDSSDNFLSAGMKDVPKWLKDLRLHKYSHLFSGLTYEQLLTTTDEQLIAKNVTKGARNKLINCISNLKLRPKQLKRLENGLIEEGIGSVVQTLSEVDSVLMTPFKPYDCIESHLNIDSQTNGYTNSCHHLSDEDLPEIITQLLGKVFDILVERSEKDLIVLFTNCVDKCLSNSSFNWSQKTRLIHWKQVLQEVKPFQLLRHPQFYQTLDSKSSSFNSEGFDVKKFDSMDSSNYSLLIDRHFSAMSSSLSIHSSVLPYIESVPKSVPMHRNNQLYHSFKDNLWTKSRTKFAAVNTRGHISQPQKHLNGLDNELNHLYETERLCIRMTEQALGLSD